MRRRNFVIGMGALAAGSGTVSLTAASFADEAATGADFRVVSDRELRVSPGTTARDDATGSISHEDSIDFDTVDTDTLPTLAVGTQASDPTGNEYENDALHYELALPNDADADHMFGDTDTDEGVYRVENNGLDDEDVRIDYRFGADVETEEDAQFAAEIFQLQNEDGFAFSADHEDAAAFTQTAGGTWEAEGQDTIGISPGEQEEFILETAVTDHDRINEMAGLDDEGTFGIFDDDGEDNQDSADLLAEIEFGIPE